MRHPFYLPVISVWFCLCLSALSQPTNTESFVKSRNQIFYLDLDTAAGNISQWRHEDLSSLNSLTATLRVPQLRDHRKWLPAFAIWLQEVGPSERRRRIGLKLVAPQRKPPLELEVVEGDTQGEISSETLATRLGLNEDLKVTITWATPHSVSIIVGERESRTFSVPWQIGSLAVTSSTGQMKVDPIVLGSNQTGEN